MPEKKMFCLYQSLCYVIWKIFTIILALWILFYCWVAAWISWKDFIYFLLLCCVKSTSWALSSSKYKIWLKREYRKRLTDLLCLSTVYSPANSSCLSIKHLYPFSSCQNMLLVAVILNFSENYLSTYCLID